MKAMFLQLITLCSLLLTSVELSAQNETRQSNLEKRMHKKINRLGPGHSFAYVGLGLKKKELYLIDKLKFDSSGPSQRQYDRFGDLELLKNELPVFLREIGNDDDEVIQAVTDIISRTAHDVAKASNKTSAWVCVRSFLANHDYDIPRWHIDGKYFDVDSLLPYPGLVFKFAAALKGRPTLLYNLPDEQRGIFIDKMEDRIFLSELLDLNKAESPKKGQGVFFIVADVEIGAVHSEPKMDENRFFFSILPGDESEIQELYSRWYPEKN